MSLLASRAPIIATAPAGKASAHHHPSVTRRREAAHAQRHQRPEHCCAHLRRPQRLLLRSARLPWTPQTEPSCPPQCSFPPPTRPAPACKTRAPLATRRNPKRTSEKASRPLEKPALKEAKPSSIALPTRASASASLLSAGALASPSVASAMQTATACASSDLRPVRSRPRLSCRSSSFSCPKRSQFSAPSSATISAMRLHSRPFLP